MKLTAQHLQDILDTAKAAVEDDDIDFNYQIDNYNLHICYELHGRWEEKVWVIEPNEVDDDGCSEPIGGWSKIVPYGDYAQLLVACAEVAERKFKEE
jgi:hypothetical protein